MFREWTHPTDERAERVEQAVQAFDREVEGLHHEVRKLKAAPDPWQALVKAIRYNDPGDRLN